MDIAIKSLYETTGDIKDFNTMLVNAGELRDTQRNSDRWNLFTQDYFPITFRGELYHDIEALNAAVDAAIKEA